MGKCSCCGALGRTITGCSCRGGHSHVCLKLKTEEGLKEPKPEPDRVTKPDEKHVEVVVVAQAKLDRDTKPRNDCISPKPKADLDTKPHDKHVVLEPKPESEFDKKPQKENVEVLVEPDEHTVSVNVSVHIRSR